VSTNLGRTWFRRKITTQSVYAVAAVPSRGRQILAGAGGGIYRSRDGGRHWTRTLRLHNSAATAFVWLPGSSRDLFAGTVAGAPGGATSVYVSHDAGRSWQPFGRDLNDGGGIMSLFAAGHHLYAGTMGHAVWVTETAGGLWRGTAAGMPVVNDHVGGLALTTGRRREIFAATLGQGVFRRAIGQRTWSNVSTGLPRTSGLAVVLSLTFDRNDHTLYAGTLDGIYQLTVP